MVAASCSGFSATTQPQFWVAVLEIIWINVLLSGDNAIVIALACRRLPSRQRTAGIVLGTAAALVLRLVFASIVVTLMLIPWVKMAGGVALLWIAAKLLMQNDESSEEADAPAIVMGQRGRSGLKSFLLGSVSRDVVNAQHRPVILV